MVDCGNSNIPTLVNISVLRRELDTKVTFCSVDCGNPVSNPKFYLVIRQIDTLLIESLFLATIYQSFSLPTLYEIRNSVLQISVNVREVYHNFLSSQEWHVQENDFP